MHERGRYWQSCLTGIQSQVGHSYSQAKPITLLLPTQDVTFLHLSPYSPISLVSFRADRCTMREYRDKGRPLNDSLNLHARDAQLNEPEHSMET